MIEYKFKSVDFFIEEYKELYNILFCKQNIPENIIILQKRVLKILQYIDEDINMEKKLKRRNSNFNFFKLPNYSYFQQAFRALIDVAIYKYICEDEKIIFLALTTDFGLNHSINLKYIERYIDDICEKQKDSPQRISIITDFSLANLQCGDVIYRESNYVNYYDIKDGIINKKIISLYHNNPDYIPENSSEKRQLIRIQKQMKRWEIIDKHLNEPLFRSEDDSIIFPYNINGVRFTSQFKKCLEQANNKLFSKIIVDDCISIMAFNLKKLNKILDKKTCIIEAYKELESLDEPQIIFEIIDKYKFHEQNEFSFLFNNEDHIFNPYLTPPYIYGISLEEVLILIKGEIAVYIEVNIDNIFQEIRNLGFKLYPKKEREKMGIFRYKNRNYILEINGIKHRLGSTFIQRIISDFYTMEMIKTFFLEYYKPFFEEVGG